MRKKISASLFTVILLFSTASSHANLIDKLGNRGKYKQISNMTAEQKEARMVEINNRVEAIRTLDPSTMSKSEKKSIRKELKEMKREAKVVRGGIYLSLGAIVVIILLLVLFL